jgi:hypothetical protein
MREPPAAVKVARLGDVFILSIPVGAENPSHGQFIISSGETVA